MSFLLELLANIVGESVVSSMANGRGHDRRLLKQNKVRASLRSETGHVLNMGTEWSIGVCEISPGRIHFVASVGIVGDRHIPVRVLRPMDAATVARHNLRWEDSRKYVVVSDAGNLLWTIPEHVADRVVGLLLP